MVGEGFFAETACSFLQDSTARRRSAVIRLLSMRQTLWAMDGGIARLNVTRKTETMGSQRNNVRKLRNTDNQERRSVASVVEKNVQATKRWERAVLYTRLYTLDSRTG
jgi:hypothetical protein